MITRFSLSILLATFGSIGMVTPTATAEDFSFRRPLSKTVLGDTFPKGSFIFRGENRRETGPGYAEWEQDVAGNVGIIRKFVREELDMPVRMDEARLSSYIKRYAAAHPNELFLLHFNARAKLFDFHADKFWVGHYLQRQGVQSVRDIHPNQTTIRLPSANGISLQRPLSNSPATGKESLLLLVGRDQNGVFDWDHHEFVYLNKIDRDNNELTLTRGAHGTQPKHFEPGECYVCQIQQFRTRMVMNLSTDCPRSPDGKQAADVLLDLFESWFRRGGLLEPLDGIAFDVQYWDISSSFDTDLDGVADGGIIDGQPRWAQGMHAFSKAIRDRFGDDFLILSDGHRRDNAQPLGIHNGLESEGLVQHNDGWRGLSRTVNTHGYWNQFNTSKIKFNYVVAKFRDREDLRHQPRLLRFAHAMAACLGAGCTYEIDESKQGVEQKHFWLGKPLGPMINLAEQSDQIVYRMPDVVNDSDLQRWSAIDGVTVKANPAGGITMGHDVADSTSTSGQTVVNAEGDTVLTPIVCELTLDIPPGDLFVTFDVRSETARTGFPGTDVPRLMSFNLSGHHDDPRVGRFGNDLWTLVGPRDDFKSEFYVRNAGGTEGRKNVTIELRVNGPGDVFLKNLVVRNASAFHAREFEHGVVVVNPSLKPATIDLVKQFGPHDYTAIQSSDPNDTANSSLNNSANNSLNNGLPIQDPTALELAPVSAQFIVKP